jgi:hypothetical protein
MIVNHRQRGGDRMKKVKIRKLDKIEATENPTIVWGFG